MPTQANKFLEVKTPLGDDALLLHSFAGTEQISRLFQFDLDMSSEEAELKFEDIIGQKAGVRVDLADGSQRWFHGIVSRFSQGHADGRQSSYRATLVPWLWLLTRASDCRIFQNLSVPDILQKVFEGHGFSGDDFELRLSGSYQPWEYCVQYRETDFNFVSRLMEQEGIYYFFEHEEDKHKLIIGDSPAAHAPFGDYATIRYHPPGKESEMREETITDWSIEKEVQAGVYALKDFNFKKPGLALAGNSPISREHEKSDFEVFDYPGEYEESAEAESYAKLRIQELQAQYETLRGQASARGVATGAKFSLSEHPRDDQNRPYLVTSTSIHVSTGDYESGSGDEGEYFSCSFTAIPFDQPFRAPRVTPKPMIQGPQTAFVVGPSGEEIHTDEFGRIKLQFHWDRHGKSNQDSSCWVRVTQMGWAGEKWGGIHIPRMGQEVIVEFLEGDPDRPIVTGRVYNAKTTVPYALPANKTQSGLKSRSSKGGSDANFNEIRFEDKKGDEMLSIQAEKDREMLVKNDNNEIIGHDETITVGHDQTETVKNNRAVQVGVNHTEDIGANMSINVGSSLTEMVAINYAETVGAAMELTVGAALAITVGAAMSETVGGVKTESVGMAKSENIGGNRSLNVGGDKSETIAKNRNVTVTKDQKTTIGGQQKIAVTKDSILNAKKVQIVAEDEIQLKTGSADITLKKNGDILINGKKIEIKGSGDVVIKGSQIKEN